MSADHFPGEVEVRRRFLRAYPHVPCPHCGYEVRGLPTETCPECGHDADLAAIVRAQLRPTLRSRITNPDNWPWLLVGSVFLGMVAIGLTMERGGLGFLVDPITLAVPVLALASGMLWRLPSAAELAGRWVVGAWWALLAVELGAIAAALVS